MTGFLFLRRNFGKSNSIFKSWKPFRGLSKGFNQIIDLVKEKRKDLKIYGANMELCSPTLEETIEKIVKEDKDITKIGIVPFFLFEGIHIKEDIPEIIEKLSEKYKNIEFSFGKPLGADPILADILLKRAEEIL